MAGIYFLSENHVLTADLSITTGAANAQFPLSNIKNDSPSIKFRSTGNTVVIELDLLQTRTLNAVALMGDPVGTFYLTNATLKTSTTTDFTLSTPVVLDISADHNIGYSLFGSVSHRYAELTLTGTGSFAELGTLFLGQAINIAQNSLSIGSFKYGYKDKSVIAMNRYGQRFIDQLNLVKMLGGGLDYCTKAEQEELDDMFIRHGESVPLWMIVDPNNDGMNEGQYKLSIYGYLTEVPMWSAHGGQHYSAEINIEEAV